jgi:hypothetical protein
MFAVMMKHCPFPPFFFLFLLAPNALLLGWVSFLTAHTNQASLSAIAEKRTRIKEMSIDALKQN